MQRRRFIFILIISSLYCTGQLAPVANFSVSSDTICAKDTIRFTDLSLNDPIFRNWSVPGAVNIYSTNVNPTFLFPPAGSYTAIFTVTNLQGTDTMMKVLTVLTGPTVTATSSAIIVGEHEPVTLSATGAVAYTWSTGHTDSVIVVSHSSLGSVTYYVVGSNSRGCSDTARVNLVVMIIYGVSENITSVKNIQSFPNPGSGTFMVKIEPSQHAEYTVFDLNGIQLHNGSTESADQFEIDLGTQPPGIYILMVKRESGISTVKLVKE